MTGASSMPKVEAITMNAAGLASKAADTNLSSSATMKSVPDLAYTNQVKNSVTKVVPLRAVDGGIQGTIVLPNELRATLLEEVTIKASKTGWKVGEPITNLTARGNVPVWTTVRQRFWKNEALLNRDAYNPINIPRMQRGLAPQRINPSTGVLESMELHHHLVPQRKGGLFDFMKVWPDEHRALDPFRR